MTSYSAASNEGPPQREQNDGFEDDSEPAHDGDSMNRYEENEGEFEGYGDQGDGREGTVLKRGLVNARRRLSARAPEGVENLSLLLASAAPIDVKFHKTNDKALAGRPWRCLLKIGQLLANSLQGLSVEGHAGIVE